ARFRPSEVLAGGIWRMLTEADLDPGEPEAISRDEEGLGVPAEALLR
ncbi:MAG: hypothetical protein JO264_05570, partial [Acidisphaera sp.]|nr:hypothetical protein [Acidisphaera sp.]